MQTAFIDTEKLGIERGTPEYFEFFERRLGYEPSGGDYDEDDDMGEPSNLRVMPPPQRSAPVSAAPVSRAAPGVSAREQTSSTRVTLTPQQREAAKFSNLNEREYAKNLQKLNDMKRKGYYTESG
jgi:hypothetical protein